MPHETIHIISHTLLDSLKIVPFLLIAFLIIEIIEHKLTQKSKKLIKTSGKLGPLFGSLLGIIPQCGFSVIATNLYVTRIISLGTLISIYLSTSDEMLPILLSKNAPLDVIIKILLTKFFIGMISGFVIDFILRKKDKRKTIEDYSICDEEHCDCKKNIFTSALKHTIKTISFIIIVTLILNILMEYLGNEYIEKVFMKNNMFGPFVSSLVGLIPNCGSSVILTELYLKEVIPFSSALSGLLTGSGVAILVLFKANKNIKENLTILLLIYLIGSISGIILNII